MENIADLELPFPKPELFLDSPFSLKNQLAVMINFVSFEQAYFSLQEIYSQYFPITQCFLILRSDFQPKGVEDLQILFPPMKVYHREKLSFMDAVLQLTKILDTQYVAAFTNTELANKWKIAEALNKIMMRETWKVILNENAISFVTLRLALENAPEELVHELAGDVLGSAV